ncbi:MAG: serine/threonine protein kinase, partial [Gemmataceae bacterium]|nr:serine/threonine protein kinase [Gemmataceae bacterium]
MNELDLFVAANAIPDPAERAAYLDRACADQPELRLRLEALLAGNAQSRHPLDQPPNHLSADATSSFGDPAATSSLRAVPSVDEAEGTVVAERYKLRQQIGEGGMGSVWMADQTEPVKRKVAVKLIRVERGQSKTILARFEAERQAIALMDHPHIAKLLDAGTTETGAPFFVMELVKGVPLNDYCDEHKLTIHERLILFTQICSAVQHAHQKGIIHRDLKPSNILVESHDGKPVPKVIDFGLAKATTGMQLTDQSMFTAFGSVMGTPLYMAPEQATFNAVDVDTRADVYALGVILYELLTGTTPLTKETMKKAALDEMLKLIREQEAPTPSSRLSSSDNAPSVAASRQMEPLKLGRFVKGELDWIVLKALSKDRDRRYETANGFARDVERFLSHEPVTAGPPSASYRFQKFVQRNRGQVIAASLVLAALLAGVVGTTVGLVEAKKQEAEATKQTAIAQANESLANTRLQEVETEKRKVEAEKQRADEEKQIAQAVNDFLQNKLLAQ